MTHVVLAILAVLVGLHASSQPALSEPPESTPERAVWDLLEAMNAASYSADTAYFDLFAEDAVFFGTDLWERWTKPEFEALYRPYMQSGRGWSFPARGRRVEIQPCGTIALFDEVLHSDTFGPCRGTGAARLGDGGWKIVRYHLDITIPNGVVDEVVPIIRRWTGEMVITVVRTAVF